LNRGVQVLDQLERNPDQQSFLLTILVVLETRCTTEPSLFDGLPLTVLGGVCGIWPPHRTRDLATLAWLC
jgi:hypothetical protein